ncbi:MAG: DUF1045 domain-containing protein [Rhodospirillales bacterium]|nr:DUF1045 domain-containing protein [Rhodospirillales bacterium]
MPRYAIYYAPPPGSELRRRGAAWLGRDAAGGAAAHALTNGIAPDRRHAVTREPSRYGLHATLKAPFHLADGRSTAALDAALAAFAATTAPVALGLFEVSTLAGFVALRPRVAPGTLGLLVAEIVESFDGFRRPPGDGELERRHAAGLTYRQAANLRRWGYPYVMEDFRFHITLTGPLEDPERATIASGLASLLGPALASPVALDALTLFVEPKPGGAFYEVARYALTGAGALDAASGARRETIAATSAATAS